MSQGEGSTSSPYARYLPEIAKEAPFERPVVKEMLSVMDDEGSLLFEYGNEKWHREPYMSYTVLRARLDSWFAERVAEKGCFVIPGRRADELLWEDGRIAGVRSGGEDIPAHMVIAADGALSFMAEKAGLRSRRLPKDYAVAMKEVYALDAKTIEERFGLAPGEGAACLFMGAATKGMFGGGFLYTNEASLSVGLVVGIGALAEKGGTVESHRLMEDFVARPEIQRWVKGGELKEYSSHVIPEAGMQGVSKPFTGGMLVVGDAAGLALNLGITVRGMEFAIASGVMAAEVAEAALAKGDTSEEFLSLYERRLKDSFVLKDLETFRHSRAVLENPRLFTTYPRFFCELAESLFTIGSEPKPSLYRTAMKQARKYVLGWEGFKDFLSFRRV